jgi:hypothetical protein
MATDELSEYYSDLLNGSYDCVDRIVLNANFGLCYSPGGFRSWWRLLNNGSDEDLDNAHLMRMAGRFARRLRAYAEAHRIPVMECGSEQRKHQIAEQYLQEHPCARGLFLILVSRAMASLWDVQRSKQGVICNLEAKRAFINHYSFHIIDPDWGHITIKLAGHPPFGAQIILNGHEYVACQARRKKIGFVKEGNCFTIISKAAELAKVADTLSEARTVGRLSQLCERWIYSSCLCFALSLQEQMRTRFRYQYSIYQIEYSRNLIFRRGGQMDQIFQGLIDRTRVRLNVKRLKTIFGRKGRPHRDRKVKPRLEAVVETPAYDLTVFKLHFGKLTLKAYTKGECVLRFEAIVHNTKELRCGRLLERFPLIVTRLRQILERFLGNLYCMDAAFVSDNTLDELPQPSQVGHTHVGGIDVNKPRTRAVLSAALALAFSADGFTTGQFAVTVQSMLQDADSGYSARRAAYDLKKLRGKNLVCKVAKSRRYRVPPAAIRTMGALVLLREKVLRPILSAVRNQNPTAKPVNYSDIDEHYQAVRQSISVLLGDLRIAA